MNAPSRSPWKVRFAQGGLLQASTSTQRGNSQSLTGSAQHDKRPMSTTSRAFSYPCGQMQPLLPARPCSPAPVPVYCRKPWGAEGHLWMFNLWQCLIQPYIVLLLQKIQLCPKARHKCLIPIKKDPTPVRNAQNAWRKPPLSLMVRDPG